MSKKAKNQPSSVLITEDILPAYRAYVEARNQISEAEMVLEKAKKAIIEFHKTNGVDRIKDKGFSSTLSEGHRETLLKEVIESKFGKLPPECSRITIYDSIRVSGSLIAE